MKKEEDKKTERIQMYFSKSEIQEIEKRNIDNLPIPQYLKRCLVRYLDIEIKA
jgi:hypothetical protein